MIFVTIGTQEPFDRLIVAMDEVAQYFKEIEVIAQLSDSKYVAKHMKTINFVSPREFNDLFEKAELIISHAGMGTIISALQINKPIIVVPRVASLGEHRNEHQLDTAKKMDSLGYAHVCYSEKDLLKKVTEVLNDGDVKPKYRLGKWASGGLITSIREFIK